MNTFPVDSRFIHPWRPYQARVLAELDEHLTDNSLHIVAAPGSGKTVLGLEVTLRLNKPTLILAPTLTIRDQWIERFVSLFLPPGRGRPEWVSTDLRRPGLITAVTYQALHSVYSGDARPEEAERDDEDEGEAPEEEANEQAAGEEAHEIARLLEERGVGTVVVDEAHHLRSEWWRALQAVRQGLPEATLVALTATPPYDVSPFEWERYRELCGAIDAEVPAPELVSCGNLCPHQDYIHFSTPTKQERARIRSFRGEVAEFVSELAGNRPFAEALARHPWLRDPDRHIESILEDPEYFSSIIIFLHHVGVAIPRRALGVLGVAERRLPRLNTEWLEVLLTRCLSGDGEWLSAEQGVLDPVERRLRRMGALERGRVCLRSNREIERALISSATKLDSIVSIVRLESDALGADLRLVILTDFIRAAELPRNPDDVKPLNRIGVAPIFEKLRREGPAGINLAVLSGSLVIIPRRAESELVATGSAMGIAAHQIKTSPLPHDAEYLRVEIAGANQNRIVQLVTRLFSSGVVTVLVGTKSLLGEGWDAPSINCLVLASFVGSYMLSNQMRGRAIRAQAGNPEKTANIWHLVCVEPGAREPSEDLETMTRRFRAFLGPSLADHVIESGVARLGVGPPPYSRAKLEQMNRVMAQHALDRAGLRERWRQALALGGVGAERVEELRAPAVSLPRGFVFANTIAALFWEAVFLGGAILAQIERAAMEMDGGSGRRGLYVLVFALLAAAVVAAPRLLKALWLLIKHGSVAASIRQIGEALLQSLRYAGAVRSPDRELRVVAEQGEEGTVYCALRGGTSYEKGAYLDALQEMLGPIHNPRYLLTRRTPLWIIRRLDYHVVPTLLGRRKELAEHFAKMWRRYVGPTELIYTRTVPGRRALLRARAHSLASAFQRRCERRSCWK